MELNFLDQCVLLVVIKNNNKNSELPVILPLKL